MPVPQRSTREGSKIDELLATRVIALGALAVWATDEPWPMKLGADSPRLCTTAARQKAEVASVDVVKARQVVVRAGEPSDDGG
jgi:hypothetical protein